MQVVEVNSADLADAFVAFPNRLYANDENYVQPWTHEIEEVFDPKRNKLFVEGELVRFLLMDVSGEVIGRIAAFTHPKFERENEATGGCGFFECINDQDAANMLFDAAKRWLISRGKTMMDGPINFGEKDKWWGLLVEGFEPPLYGMNYNFPYYQQLFENYGFQNYYNQLVYRYILTKPVPEKFRKVYDLMVARGKINYKIVCADKRNLDKYAEDFRVVYNAAWADAHEGFEQMTTLQTKRIMKTMKPIMDEDAMIFAYDGDRPIGIFLSIPNINEAIRHLNGQFGLWEKLKFIYHLKVKKSVSTLAGIVFGIVPDYQGKGVDAGMILKGDETIRQKGKYKFMEMMWIGDFNPKMIKVIEGLGVNISKRLTTYRYLFDRTAEFKRHPIINQ